MGIGSQEGKGYKTQGRGVSSCAGGNLWVVPTSHLMMHVRLMGSSLLRSDG